MRANSGGNINMIIHMNSKLVKTDILAHVHIWAHGCTIGASHAPIEEEKRECACMCAHKCIYNQIEVNQPRNDHHPESFWPALDCCKNREKMIRCDHVPVDTCILG